MDGVQGGGSGRDRGVGARVTALERRRVVLGVLAGNPRSMRPWVVAKLARLSRREVQAALRDLAAAGLVVREERGREPRSPAHYRAL